MDKKGRRGKWTKIRQVGKMDEKEAGEENERKRHVRKMGKKRPVAWQVRGRTGSLG